MPDITENMFWNWIYQLCDEDYLELLVQIYRIKGNGNELEVPISMEE